VQDKFEKGDCRRISVLFYNAAVIQILVRYDLNTRLESTRLIWYLNVDRRLFYENVDKRQVCSQGNG